MKVAKFSFLNEKSYNKTVIDFYFGRHKDLSTLKSDIHLSLAASVNYHFFRKINPYVYLIEDNNCILLQQLKHAVGFHKNHLTNTCCQIKFF